MNRAISLTRMRTMLGCLDASTSTNHDQTLCLGADQVQLEDLLEDLLGKGVDLTLMPSENSMMMSTKPTNIFMFPEIG